jgi:hypothetical protein
MAAPLADSNDEKVDLETGGRFSLAEHFQDSLLGILVLDGRTLRTFEPADHVFHWHPSGLKASTLPRRRHTSGCLAIV